MPVIFLSESAMSLRRIYRIGNSKVISLPEHLLAQIGADTGDYLHISIEGEKIRYVDAGKVASAKDYNVEKELKGR